jgi:hypothetical protein
VASVLLGILVVALGFLAAFMWFDAHHAREAADRAASRATAAAGGGGHAMPGMSAGLGSLTSYSGAAPANAEHLAAAHAPFPAAFRRSRPARLPATTSC